MAAMLSVWAEEPKTINVVGLEDDAENETVEAPPELGAKPETVSIDADLLMRQAAETLEGDHSPIAANVKALTVEGMIVPPSAEMASTLEDAIRIILRDAGKQIGTVGTNGIEQLTMPYQQLGDGKSYEVEWRKALRLLLSPVGYNFTEDGELVLFGLAEEVDVKHKLLAQERLSANRTPILFTTNETEGGMDLRSAIRDISVKADITITTDYMDPGDLYAPSQTVGSEGALTADDIGKAKDATAVQQTNIKRTTFDTNGQQVEWRIVLREILNPHDYDFVEVGGVVRIAKRAKLAQWEQEAIAAKPLTARVIRLYHADPESVVERVMKIKGILKHPNASLQASRKKDDDTDVVKNMNTRLQTGSGTKSGMSDTDGQVFEKLVRPRTVPAIIAYDVEENMDAIEAAVKLFDIKEKQILIEAIIFQLDTNNGEAGDMDGVKWEGLDDGFVPLSGSIGGASTYAAATGFAIRNGKKVWLKTGGMDFQATVQLIRQRDNTKLLASPMIVVGDHSQAAIQVSDILPVPQVDASSVAGMTGAATVQNTINIQWNMIMTGVLMWVAPEITETGTSVRLTVHPQVVTKGEEVNLSKLGGAFLNYPVYNYELKMHEMDTRATVPSGATLMFGGLIDTEEIESEKKVRWLGDLPLLGWFFRSKTTQILQKNLIVMIRPTILEDTDETGFETNALREAEPVMENMGRELKKVPLSGPYSFKETKENVMDLYEERVVKPFQDEEATPATAEPEG
jgi:type II secretory pathway component GspD/PulD (secretin)